MPNNKANNNIDTNTSADKIIQYLEAQNICLEKILIQLEKQNK